MLLNKIGIELADHFIKEVKKEDNIDTIKENLVNPLIDYTFHRLYPYILVTSIIFFLTFILALITLYIIVRS